jgi:hypothetical protein
MSSEKIEAFWKDATAKDVERVMAGETVEARFRDDEHCGYTVGLLAGWTKGDPSWLWCDRASGQSYFEFCQVYREPSWFTNKPDPGPGWRLLGKFPDEPKLGTDEAWDCHLKEWRPTFTNDGDQVKTVWYRRRIEPVGPEPKHYVLRVGDSYETPCGNWGTVMPQGSTQRILNLKAGDIIKTIHGQTITITAKGFEVTQ